jgi:peptidyl-tRNA hydrolase, PTH1 family
MKLVIGLGNPGKKYRNNRHNVGFLVLEKLKNQILNSQFSILNEFSNSNFQNLSKFQAEVLKIRDLILAKPTTFMNSSGIAVSLLATFYKLPATSIWVVHDDLDIMLGEYKIQFGKGPKVHNGISSIEEKLGTKDFWRVRIGIENRMPKIPNSKHEILNNIKLPNFQNSKQMKISGEHYVLQDFSESEMEMVKNVIEKVVKDLLQRTMNHEL